jgi:4-amino-4-deoxy-L-arabinose transferase-like glycosyltransferase
MIQRRLLYLICAAYVALATIYSLATPIFEASDELWHYPMVKYVADHSLGLPQPDPQEAWRQQGGQPPLYYMLAAILTGGIDTSDMDTVRRQNPHADIGVVRPDGNANMIVHRAEAEGFPWRGATLAAHVARFFSVVLGLGTVIITYALAREIFPNWPSVAVGAAALTAFLPMFLFISGSVNNDNLSNLLGNLLMLLMARLLKVTTAPHWRVYIFNGIVTGAGLLSKLNIGFMIPLVALTLLIVSLRLRDWKPLVIGGFIAGGLTILIAGGWYWRNYQLYGDPTGLNAFLDTVGRRLARANWQQIWAERHSFTQAYWGFFGGVNVPLPDGVYTIFNVIGGVSLASSVVFLVYVISRRLRVNFNNPTPKSPPRKRRGDLKNFQAQRLPSPLVGRSAAFLAVEGLGVRGKQHPYNQPNLLPALMTILWIAITFLSYLRWTAETPASQGRLMFGALSSLSLSMAVGVMWWLPRPFQRFMIAGVVGYFAVIAIYAPFQIISPAYTPPNLPGETIAAAGIAGARFLANDGGQINMDRGWIARSHEIHPDEYARIESIFRMDEPVNRDWSLFIHLTTEDGVIITQRDVYPGQGLLATSDLLEGFEWFNPVEIRVPPAAFAPAELNIELGWYHLPTGERMRLENGDETVTIGQIQLLPRESDLDVPNPLNINFDNQMELVGYDMSDLTPAAGDEIELTLYWRGMRPIEKNYTVFAHVINPRDLTIYAGSDAQPVNGNAPTSAWTVGDIIEDRHVLTVREDTPPDIYELEIGVYSQESDGSFPRLRIVTADGGMADNFIYLSRVRVVPDN